MKTQNPSKSRVCAYKSCARLARSSRNFCSRCARRMAQNKILKIQTNLKPGAVFGHRGSSNKKPPTQPRIVEPDQNALFAALCRVVLEEWNDQCLF